MYVPDGALTVAREQLCSSAIIWLSAVHQLNEARKQSHRVDVVPLTVAPTVLPLNRVLTRYGVTSVLLDFSIYCRGYHWLSRRSNKG